MSMKEITNLIVNSVFCYSSNEGQGLVKKENCECYVKDEKCCKAYLEREDFLKIYRELESKGYDRNQIISEIEKKYTWDETFWIQYNVKK